MVVHGLCLHLHFIKTQAGGKQVAAHGIHSLNPYSRAATTADGDDYGARWRSTLLFQLTMPGLALSTKRQTASLKVPWLKLKVKARQPAGGVAGQLQLHVSGFQGAH